MPTQRNQLDPLLSDYIEHLWSSGAGRALASDTLAAVQDKQPQVKGMLQASWRLLKTWNLNEIPNRAPPLPEPALHAMVGHAFAHNRPLFGLSLLVGFYGMLRTGELLQLQPSHISQPKLRIQLWWHWVIPREARDRVQPKVSQLVCSLFAISCGIGRSNSLLMPPSAHHLKRGASCFHLPFLIWDFKSSPSGLTACVGEELPFGSSNMDH